MIQKADFQSDFAAKNSVITMPFASKNRPTPTMVSQSLPEVDPLTKREQFAISLRHTKKQQILAEKRKRYQKQNNLDQAQIVSIDEALDELNKIAIKPNTPDQCCLHFINLLNTTLEAEYERDNTNVVEVMLDSGMMYNLSILFARVS